MHRYIVRYAALWIAMLSCALAIQASGIWLDVPYIPQPENGCGAASIAMVMQYWENNLRQEHSSASDVNTIQNQIYSKADKGILASSMEHYFEAADYRVFAIHGQWSDLQENLAKGRPLIAALQASGAHGPLHYVVVVGIDNENGLVYVNDAAQKKLLKMERAEFEKEWRGAADHWLLLAVPKTSA